MDNMVNFLDILVEYREVNDEISGSEDQDSYEHIEQAILDAFNLCRIIRFGQELHRLDDDDHEDDQ